MSRKRLDRLADAEAEGSAAVGAVGINRILLEFRQQEEAAIPEQLSDKDALAVKAEPCPQTHRDDSARARRVTGL